MVLVVVEWPLDRHMYVCLNTKCSKNYPIVRRNSVIDELLYNMYVILGIWYFSRADSSTYQVQSLYFPEVHNGRKEFYKMPFLALGAPSQYWKLNNLSNYDRLNWFFCFLSNWLVLQAAYYNLTEKRFCSNNFSNVDCKISNLKNKIAGKWGQSALIS